MTDFKVGDRVRLTGKDWGWSREMPQPGTVVTVDEIDSDGDAVFMWNEGRYYIYEGYEAVLVPPEDGVRDYDAEYIKHLMSHDSGAPEASYLAEVGVLDPISPDHYQFPGGVRVHQISAHLTSCGGQAVQYIARSTRLDGRNKGDQIENLKKAQKMIAWEIERLETEDGE